MNQVGTRYDKMCGYHYAYYDVGEMTWPDFFRLVQASPLQIVNALVTGNEEWNGTCSLQYVIDTFADMQKMYPGDERWNISIFFKDAGGNSGNLFCFPAENNVAAVQAEMPMPHLDELLDLPNTLSRL